MQFDNDRARADRHRLIPGPRKKDAPALGRGVKGKAPFGGEKEPDCGTSYGTPPRGVNPTPALPFLKGREIDATAARCRSRSRGGAC